MLKGERFELKKGEDDYPASFAFVHHPPKTIYGVGDFSILQEGLAIVGARKATPYGRGCARRFASLAAKEGVLVVSGGALGCDASAHKGALEAGGKTVVVLGGGCDELYPAQHEGLFQRIVDAGGAVISEYPWNKPPLPFQFRERNRIIAGMSKATLIVEAGLPSGTFSTADDALASGREVMVVPGAITAPSSRGSNRLLSQGAIPVVDDDSFLDSLCILFGILRHDSAFDGKRGPSATSFRKDDERQGEGNVLIDALRSQVMGMDECYQLALRCCGTQDARSWMMGSLLAAEASGAVVRYPDGRYGPAVRT